MGKGKARRRGCTAVVCACSARQEVVDRVMSVLWVSEFAGDREWAKRILTLDGLFVR